MAKINWYIENSIKNIEYNSYWVQPDYTEKFAWIGNYGRWNIYKFEGNGAIYSCCNHCNYIHPCYKSIFDAKDFYDRYDYKNEFRFCPVCGKRMITKTQIRANS